MVPTAAARPLMVPTVAARPLQALPLCWSTTLLWNRSPASNSSGAPLTTSSRGKIMLIASTPRPAGVLYFLCRLRRHCSSLHLCSSLHSGTCMCDLAHLPHWGTVGKAWIHSTAGYVHCCPRPVIQASTSKLWLAHAEGEEREAG